MRRIRVVVVAVVVLVILGGVLATVIATRVRARSRADWLQGKNLTLAPAVKGLKEPTFVVGPPDGTHRLFILERSGVIRIADANGQLNATPFLDLSRSVSTSTEEGLLGLAFHPDFAHNGYVYVDYTANDWSVQLIRYTASADHPDQLDPATAQTVLTVPKQSKYHNGGTLEFGPDGYLYVSVGDDEASDKAQALDTLVGKILRLDVDAQQPYGIPPANPFATQAGARGEIWSYGLRNPWRFGFDQATGDLWIGDVGDAKWEEVDFQPASSHGGENYGWPMNEGTECMDPARCQDPSLVPPITTYGHDMNCAVMGGYVYRGSEARNLVGRYVFGDLCTGGIFTVANPPTPGSTRIELGYQPIKVSSFGHDPDGNIYVCDLQSGVIYRIADGSVPDAPTR